VTLKSDTRADAARVAELEGALAREMRVSAALREVGLALGTTLDLDQLLELILGKITDALEADRATLYLLDEAKDELVSRIVQGDEVKSIRLKVGHGIAGHRRRPAMDLVRSAEQSCHELNHRDDHVNLHGKHPLPELCELGQESPRNASASLTGDSVSLDTQSMNCTRRPDNAFPDSQLILETRNPWPVTAGHRPGSGDGQHDRSWPIPDTVRVCR